MIREQPVRFPVGTASLEGLFRPASPGSPGAVIAHPHPLMGGEMRNPVVETLTRTMGSLGLATLRFNFRGVGSSEGSYDDGRGERDDLRAAAAYLEHRGTADILLAGYSFGAWVACGVVPERNFLPAVLVSPPVTLFPFDFPLLRGKVGLIVCGDRDPFCPLGEIRSAAAGASCHLEIIGDADHFLCGKEAELAATLCSLPLSEK